MKKKAVTRIDADWLDWPLCRKLTASLGADKVRFVGGAVRDTLLGRPIKDVDAATVWPPEETRRRLETANIKVIPTGLQHGTVTAVADGHAIEVTTLRRDVETDGRRAVVAFTGDWVEDARRRDFTMNALYLSADGTLFDPFGGVADAKAGHVRFIGEAEGRIHEDVLRIMRFFRFHAHYGKGGMDGGGLDACRKHAALLEGLSAERMRDELLKLLCARNPVPCLQAMSEADIWQHTPIADADVHAVSEMIKAEKQLGAPPDMLMRLAALTDGRPVGRVLRLSGAQSKTLKAIIAGFAAAPPADARAMRAFVYRHGVDAGVASVLRHQQARKGAMLEAIQAWDRPIFPLRGRDLINMGLAPGPKVSETLRHLEDQWLEEDFSADRDTLLKRAAEILG